ncbi:MAG: hypothetical protein IT343_17420 [Candidatus Melainabacteria bacterium]|jgi:hypothetical protein|nr:hypothetical protein [Candidatus Melainabacteria bacterium]
MTEKIGDEKLANLHRFIPFGRHSTTSFSTRIDGTMELSSSQSKRHHASDSQINHHSPASAPTALA